MVRPAHSTKICRVVAVDGPNIYVDGRSIEAL
jgi:hypothetical protein